MGELEQTVKKRATHVAEYMGTSSVLFKKASKDTLNEVIYKLYFIKLLPTDMHPHFSCLSFVFCFYCFLKIEEYK